MAIISPSDATMTLNGHQIRDFVSIELSNVEMGTVIQGVDNFTNTVLSNRPLTLTLTLLPASISVKFIHNLETLQRIGALTNELSAVIRYTSTGSTVVLSNGIFTSAGIINSVTADEVSNLEYEMSFKIGGTDVR